MDLNAIEERVNGCARGDYQENVLAGIERWSGSTLKGKARQYGARYHASREGLLGRIRGVLPDGWTAGTELIPTGSPRRLTRELVLRAPGGDAYRWHTGNLVALSREEVAS